MEGEHTMWVVTGNIAECKPFSDVGFDNREQALQHCNIEALQHPHAALGVRDINEYARTLAYHGEQIYKEEERT